MLFGIDYARQAIWERRQRNIAKAREEGQAQGREKGYIDGLVAAIAEAREKGRQEGYQLGYEVGMLEGKRRSDANGHNWMFGGPDDDR